MNIIKQVYEYSLEIVNYYTSLQIFRIRDFLKISR